MAQERDRVSLSNEKKKKTLNIQPYRLSRYNKHRLVDTSASVHWTECIGSPEQRGETRSNSGWIAFNKEQISL